jgi:hypothetical protein
MASNTSENSLQENLELGKSNAMLQTYEVISHLPPVNKNEDISYETFVSNSITDLTTNIHRNINGVSMPYDGRLLVKEISRQSPVKKIEQFSVLQKWQGQVLSINDDSEEFTALLIDKTNPENLDEEAIFSFEEIALADLPLIMEGAYFNWSIGYQTIGSTKRKSSTIHFSRLKNFNNTRIKKAKSEAKELANMFSEN